MQNPKEFQHNKCNSNICLRKYRTAKKRGTIERIIKWKRILDDLAESNYQENLWLSYQKRFLYASEITYDSTNKCLYELLHRIDI